jgi:hypothetical protein
MLRTIAGEEQKLFNRDEAPFYARLTCGHTLALAQPFKVGEQLPCSVCRNSKRGS